VLEKMDAAQRAEYEGGREKRGFSKTHPRPQSRITDLENTDLRSVEPGGRIDTRVARRRYDEALESF
jgi:hypothetical protein